ncbi:hypothetical protein NLU13_6617 [Sarocladium strictum]|uniref:F-box domain-containing protein n=1 Tax=Sarocladium strictum TaxID=5046 RepID=A0AA39GGK4_SARSR|nr:hypothetical protein NLU13_6617 [Sarocladium strictum]
MLDLQDGQHIAHMQRVASSSAALVWSPPHSLDTVDLVVEEEATPDHESEPAHDNRYLHSESGDSEVQPTKPGPIDSLINNELFDGEEARQVAKCGLDSARSAARVRGFSDVIEGAEAPNSVGGLLRDSRISQAALTLLPNELLFHIFSFLDVCDLLSTSRVNQLLRGLSLAPLLHRYRLQRNRILLPPLLASPCRPSLAELIARSIFMTKTSVVSRRLARSLVSIRLSRRLAARPSVEALVDRAVLPKECVPGMASVHVAPALVAKRKAIEKERTKDALRRWVGAKWRREVREREADVRKMEESRGVGRVWRLRRFWERVSRGDIAVQT